MKLKISQDLLGINKATLLKKIDDLKLETNKDSKGSPLLTWEDVIKIKKNISQDLDTKSFSLAICQNKGGVGKTSLTINLGWLLSQLGKTLLIDLDGQANLSQAHNIFKSRNDFTLMDALDNKDKIKDSIVQINERLDIIPNIQSFDSWKKGAIVKMVPQFALKKALKFIENDYDFILFDCPPSLDLSFEMAVCAANYQLIILDGHIFSLQGLENIFTETSRILEDSESNMEILGIAFNKYDDRSTVIKQISDVAYQLYPDMLFNTKIREVATVGKSQVERQNIFLFDDESNICRDIYFLLLEILKKINN